MEPSKALEWEQTRRLNLAYQAGLPELHLLVDLLNRRREQRLELLVKASPQTFAPLQGECNALQELLQDITTQKTIGNK